MSKAFIVIVIVPLLHAKYVSFVYAIQCIISNLSVYTHRTYGVQLCIKKPVQGNRNCNASNWNGLSMINKMLSYNGK